MAMVASLLERSFMKQNILLLMATVGFVCLGILCSAPDALAAEPPDPCSLLSTSELESTFGKLKGPPKPEVGVQKDKECHYENMDGNFLVLRVYTSERWGMQKGINSESNPTSLAGLGEEAFMVKKGTDKEIYIRKKDWILEIDSSADSEKVKALAAPAAAKLP
jgi:hypothetical protein